MKQLFSILAVFALMFATLPVIPVQGATATATLVAHTVNTPLTTGKRVTGITVIDTSSAVTTVLFYDANANTPEGKTNIVQAQYTNFTTYTTNFTTEFTGELGTTLTNTFSGLVTWPTIVAAVTNELTKKITITVPADGTRTLTGLNLNFIKGVNILAASAAIVELTYD